MLTLIRELLTAYFDQKCTTFSIMRQKGHIVNDVPFVRNPIYTS
jgi:hypothetical protein